MFSSNKVLYQPYGYGKAGKPGTIFICKQLDAGGEPGTSSGAAASGLGRTAAGQGEGSWWSKGMKKDDDDEPTEDMQVSWGRREEALGGIPDSSTQWYRNAWHPRRDSV